MVHYIRFLRTPQCDVGKKGVDVSAVVAVQTDLSDALLHQDVDLVADIVEANSPHRIICSELFQWQAASRALKLTLKCPGKYLSLAVRLHVTTKVLPSSLKTLEVPKILDVWSHYLVLSDKQRSVPIVERQLLLSNETCVRIWEDTGESMARHIWYDTTSSRLIALTFHPRDASIGFLIYFAQALSPSLAGGTAMLSALIKSSKVRRLRVLELGAGCGIVGIAFAQLVKCDMHLTDLEDAQATLAQNIECASLLAGSTLQASVLDWAAGLEDGSNLNPHLVLVSDCIYNPDSSVQLVEILRQLATRMPNTLIVVGFKRRHEADTVFFERMREADFGVLETVNLTLPHTPTDHDSDTPTAEFYTFSSTLARY